jgi:hypothetical protein
MREEEPTYIAPEIDMKDKEKERSDGGEEVAADLWRGQDHTAAKALLVLLLFDFGPKVLKGITR